MSERVIDIIIGLAIIAGFLFFLGGCALCPACPSSQYYIDDQDVIELECINDGERTICQ